MASCMDCIFLGWTPHCDYWLELPESPFDLETAGDVDSSCADFQPASKLLEDELAGALDAILDVIAGHWFSYTRLAGSINEAEGEAQKLLDRAYAALARHAKERG